VYLRFVIDKLDVYSGRRQGLFQAISDLEHPHVLLAREQNQYDQLYERFRKYLKKPISFTRSSKPHAKKVALSWYKDTATEQLKKMRELCAMIEAHDLRVVILQTNRPGFVVYEDEFQIVAEPFQDAPT
jgi:50S ribosomal subunit-associated GTPase HflX